MPEIGSSPTLLMALRDLGSTDGKVLLKLALRHLIVNRVLRPDVQYVERAYRRPERRPVFVDGPGTVPRERLLCAVAQSVAETQPMFDTGERVVRDLASVAQQLSWHPGRKHAVKLALDDLHDAGLVHAERQVRLRVLRRTVYTRTPAGQETLTRTRIPQHPQLGQGPPEMGYVAGYDYSDAGLTSPTSGDQPRAMHADPHSDFDAAFDGSFDGGFDGGDGGGDGGGD